MLDARNFFMEMPSHCGCVLEEGCRGSRGWHFRPSVHPETGTPNEEAFERCPAYWKDHNKAIDPHDRRKFLDLSETKAAKGVKA